jgi:hypothetical protein
LDPSSCPFLRLFFFIFVLFFSGFRSARYSINSGRRSILSHGQTLLPSCPSTAVSFASPDIDIATYNLVGVGFPLATLRTVMSSYYEPQGWQAPVRQVSWEQPVPPSRSGRLA